MSFGVIVGARTALPAKGATTLQDTLFLACNPSAGPTTSATLCRSILDFQSAYSARSGMSVATYDYADAFFRFGGKRLIVGRYTSGGTYADAFNLFTPDLGAGQLAVVGTAPSTQLFADMQTHCAYSVGPAMNNRVALRDMNFADTVATMETVGDMAPVNDDLGATFGPWVQIPAPAGVYGAGPRFVPASAAVAGNIALADSHGNPNRAAAGDDYPLDYATGFATTVSDADQAGLQQHGVNALRMINGTPEVNAFQTNVPESPDNPFWQFNCSRARMYLKARAQARGSRYRFRNIDGQGHLAGALKGDLMEEFKALYDVDGLFGATPQDAYAVEVGEVVNTINEVAQGHLHAVAAARFSLYAKAVLIDLVSIPISGSVTSA